MRIYNKYILLSAMMSVTAVASAQDTYDANNMMNSDLNGTARFVAMGGALSALGGDISVMSTNPAGTAMYRKSDAAFTLSGLFTDEGAMGHDASRMSFDQGGAVFTFDMHNPVSDGLQYVNFGVNYQKNRNFLGNSLISVQNLNGLLSQTWQIADMANWCYDYNSWGLMADMAAPIYYDDGSLKKPGIIGEDEYGYFGYAAQDAYYERATYGGVSQVDVNLSFNNSDRYFYGFSIGLYDVDYNRESFYSEASLDGYVYDFTNWYSTSGQGFDLKFGFICRPIEDSPFRFGLTVHTPTWYGLTDANGSDLHLTSPDGYVDRICPVNGGTYSNPDFNYQLRTPWKFGVSLGHTFGTNVALGAEYEYQDQSTARFDNAADDYNNDTRKYFRQVNDITKHTLKGQHTLKLGGEYKPVDNVAFRLGYNLVTSPFKSDAYRYLYDDGIYTETDYTNWKAMHRFSLGVGFRFKGGYFDVAYQYQTQKGDFYAFDNYAEDEHGMVIPETILKPTSITNDRSQLMGTLGFRF